jgi:hypothetical protein
MAAVLTAAMCGQCHLFITWRTMLLMHCIMIVAVIVPGQCHKGLFLL